MGCTDTVDSKTWILGAALLVGSVLCYCPQYIKFYRLKTHRGVSLANFCCAALTNFVVFLGLIASQYNSTVACCDGSHPIEQCVGKNLGSSQLVFIWVCSSMVVVLFMWYFDFSAEAAQPLMPIETATSEEPKKKGFTLPCGVAACLEDEYSNAKLQVGLMVLCKVSFATALLLIFFLDSTEGQRVKDFSAVMQYFASVVIAVHWLPQIYVTYTLGSLGSLSFIMLVIQCVGSLVTAYNICGGFECPWETWMPYIVATIMIGAVVVIASVQWVHANARRNSKTSRTTVKSKASSMGVGSVGSSPLQDVDLNSDDEDANEGTLLDSPVATR